MARERTFAAWMRTSLGTIGGGFALAKLSADVGWPANVLGVVLIAAGMLIDVAGAWQARKWATRGPLEGLPTWAYTLVAVVIAVVALAMIALLLV